MFALHGRKPVALDSLCDGVGDSAPCNAADACCVPSRRQMNARFLSGSGKSICDCDCDFDNGPTDYCYCFRNVPFTWRHTERRVNVRSSLWQQVHRRMVHYLKFFPSDLRLSYNTHLSAFADIVTTSHLVMSTDCVNPHRT